MLSFSINQKNSVIPKARKMILTIRNKTVAKNKVVILNTTVSKKFELRLITTNCLWKYERVKKNP